MVQRVCSDSKKVVRHLILVCLAVFMVGAIHTVYAGDKGTVHHLYLSDHDFDDWSFVPKKNDQIIITNHSEVSHAIYVTDADGTVVNLGIQTPGESVTWQVPSKGEFLFQCWIHPIIRTTILVK